MIIKVLSPTLIHKTNGHEVKRSVTKISLRVQVRPKVISIHLFQVHPRSVTNGNDTVQNIHGHALRKNIWFLQIAMRFNLHNYQKKTHGFEQSYFFSTDTVI